MLAIPARVQQPDIKTPVAVGFTHYVALGALAFAAIYGTATIAGGAARWSSPAYEAALSVPGAPESWGAVLLGAAFLGLLGFAVRILSLVLLAFGICAGWSATFACAIGIVAWRNPSVGWGGVIVWGFIAFLYAACTAAGAGRFHARA